MNEKIRELTNVEDFKEVYRTVFGGAPYFEKYTDEELEEIYNEYKENGYVYCAYDKGKCIGLIALERGVKKEHPVNFDDDKNVMYLADLAVLGEYRRKGIGSQLMVYAVMESKSLGYDMLYMRTLIEGSNSRKLAKRLGFVECGDVQIVETIGLDGKPQTRRDGFLVEDLNNPNLEQNIRNTMNEMFAYKDNQKSMSNNKKGEVEV